MLLDHAGDLGSKILIVYGDIDERSAIYEGYPYPDRCGKFIVACTPTPYGRYEHVGVSSTESEAIA